MPTITALPVPVTRRLQRFHGTLEEVEADILAYDNSAFQLVAWADVLVRSDEAPAEVQRRVQAVLQLQKPKCWPPRACDISGPPKCLTWPTAPCRWLCCTS